MKLFLRLLKYFSFILVLLVLVGTLLIYLVPLRTFTPFVEQQLSKTLNETVVLQGMHAGFDPAPFIALDGLTLGRAQYAKIAEVIVKPELGALWQMIVKRQLRGDINEVEFRNVKLASYAFSQPAMQAIMAQSSQPSASPSNIYVKRISFRDISLQFEKEVITPLGGYVDFDRHRGFRRAEVNLAGRQLVLRVSPDDAEVGVLKVDLSAANWKLPIRSDLTIDSIQGEGTIKQQTLTLPTLQGKLLGGTFEGQAVIAWQAGYQMVVKGQFKEIDVKGLAQLSSAAKPVGGKLFANIDFQTASDEAAELISNPTLNAEFQILDGVISNIDLPTAVRLFTRKGVQGGQTLFQQLSGNVSLKNQYFQFRNVNLTAGLLTAVANIDVTPRKQLDGRIQVRMNNLGNVLNVPLKITGDMKTPTLYPDINPNILPKAKQLLDSAKNYMQKDSGGQWTHMFNR